MDSFIDLREMEKRVFASTFSDGLVDIMLGMVLLQFVITPILTDFGLSDFIASALFMPVYLIAFLAFYFTKKYVIKPRMGSMKPGPARRLKLIKVNLILLIVFFFGLIMGLVFVDHISKINSVFPLTFSIITLLVSFTAGYYLNVVRLFIYGLLIAIAPLTGEILWIKGMVSHHGFPLVFGIVSAIIIISGSVRLVLFLKNNPITKGAGNAIG